jgi:hypothetical protein
MQLKLRGYDFLFASGLAGLWQWWDVFALMVVPQRYVEDS